LAKRTQQAGIASLMPMAPRGENDSASGDLSANTCFDADVVIRDLLADPSCASIELPRMLTAEQRKHAKQIIQQHPSLKCESFGIGDDRQMHVFKQNVGMVPSKNSGDCSAQSVSVKNTFIDDWVQPSDTTVDARNVQSMPHNMFAQHLSAEMSGAATSTSKGYSSAVSQIYSAATPMAGTATKMAPSLVPQTAREPSLMEYSLGTEVIIDGLLKAPAFNGAIGTIQSWDADSQRYDILLTHATPSGHRWAKVKSENLRRALPAGPISFGSFDP